MIQTSTLTLEEMRDMPIDQIVQLYQNGHVLEDVTNNDHPLISGEQLHILKGDK